MRDSITQLHLCVIRILSCLVRVCPYRIYNIIPTASIRATNTAYPSEAAREPPRRIYTQYMCVVLAENVKTLTAHVGRFTTGLAAGLCSIRVYVRVYIMRKPHFFVTRRAAAAAAAALPFYKRTRASCI
uniref:Secreted protein n=1 Tax=Trichogramma kaykai TaxID=54128 RepID=A0ABD2XLW3_9HYME